MRINWASDNLGTDLAELLDAIVEGQDLGGADEGECQGVEEEDEVFSLEVSQLQLLHGSVVDGCALPVRRGLGDHGLGPLQGVTWRFVVGWNSST